MASLKKASKVVCIGRNYAFVPISIIVASKQVANYPTYRDHIKELSSAKPKQPFFFLKPASSILGPKDGPVIRPRGVDLHYEVELALIMGKRVKNLEPEDEKGALDAIECLCPPICLWGCAVC